MTFETALLLAANPSNVSLVCKYCAETWNEALGLDPRDPSNAHALRDLADKATRPIQILERSLLAAAAEGLDIQEGARLVEDTRNAILASAKTGG